jgi:muramoyltetrapeptide carboxypeptidase
MTPASASQESMLPQRRRPARLSREDRIALVSPAGPPTSENLTRAVTLIESWGFVPVVAEHAGAVDRRAGYLAGSDAQRAADLRSAWLDPSIAAVFCLRGGYGSMRLLDLLDFDELRAAPTKLLIGSSDITALHQAWNSRVDVATLFSPMIGTRDLLDDPVTTENVRMALQHPESLSVLRGSEARSLVSGEATGVLVGGNLSLISASIGAPEFRLPIGGIGLLEEVHEEPYRLDLLLLQLRRSGWLDSLAAVALGSWEDCGDPDEVEALLAEYLTPLGIPVIWQLGFGHCASALVVPLGIQGRLVSDDDPRIEVVEPI